MESLAYSTLMLALIPICLVLLVYHCKPDILIATREKYIDMTTNIWAFLEQSQFTVLC